MATIAKRGDRWQARVRRTGYPEQSDTFRTKAAAERWARDIEGRMDSGGYAATHAEAKRFTLADALDRYEREVTPRKRGRDRELKRITAWRQHQLAARALVEIRPRDLAAHRDARMKAGRSPNTIRLELALLSHIFTTARREWGFTGLVNPVADTAKPSLIGTARDRRLRDGEESKLLEACANRSAWLAPVVHLAIETAMRRGEIAALRDDMIDGDVIRLALTKNGTARAVPLSPAAHQALAAVRAACGGAIALPGADAISKEFAAAVRAAGLRNLHFHDLRHEGTSRLFEHGLALQEVAAITGHKTWSQLARYTHPKAEALAKKLAARGGQKGNDTPAS